MFRKPLGSNFLLATLFSFIKVAPAISFSSTESRSRYKCRSLMLMLPRSILYTRPRIECNLHGPVASHATNRESHAHLDAHFSSIGRYF